MLSDNKRKTISAFSILSLLICLCIEKQSDTRVTATTCDHEDIKKYVAGNRSQSLVTSLSYYIDSEMLCPGLLIAQAKENSPMSKPQLAFPIILWAFLADSTAPSKSVPISL